MASETAKVAQRCEEAKGGSRALDLSDCDLRKFPDAVYFLMKGIQLDTLSLSRNHLKLIPAKLGTKFSTLTRLDVSFNHLTTLPSELANMNQLVSLNISYNFITSLPESFESLASLRDLNISHNQISLPSQAIPDSLQYLNVSNNLLMDLLILTPSSNLKEINISNNQLSTVNVDNLLLLPWLESVDIRNNPLQDDNRLFLKSVVRIKFLLED